MSLRRSWATAMMRWTRPTSSEGPRASHNLPHTWACPPCRCAWGRAAVLGRTLRARHPALRSPHAAASLCTPFMLPPPCAPHPPPLAGGCSAWRRSGRATTRMTTRMTTTVSRRGATLLISWLRPCRPAPTLPAPLNIFQPARAGVLSPCNLQRARAPCCACPAPRRRVLERGRGG